jgi:hypothetical protein
VCIYSGPATGPHITYAVTHGATGNRVWSWRKFKFLNCIPWIEKLMSDLRIIFESDPEVEFLGLMDDIP